MLGPREDVEIGSIAQPSVQARQAAHHVRVPVLLSRDVGVEGREDPSVRSSDRLAHVAGVGRPVHRLRRADKCVRLSPPSAQLSGSSLRHRPNGRKRMATISSAPYSTYWSCHQRKSAARIVTIEPYLRLTVTRLSGGTGQLPPVQGRHSASGSLTSGSVTGPEWIGTAALSKADPSRASRTSASLCEQGERRGSLPRPVRCSALRANARRPVGMTG
ncbi:hypothetical protein FHS94_003238 [Sphingomonas aerophila]|jgi:hypothetical protein|uniref:Uncharacterized protein n=1 Tax=Sphingomonas aerophila TaxID=1344948 RepID=A0A7W9EVM2_9SPHN|nr:hypothetical protein [Sphingomonas aerophila]